MDATDVIASCPVRRTPQPAVGMADSLWCIGAILPRRGCMSQTTGCQPTCLDQQGQGQLRQVGAVGGQHILQGAREQSLAPAQPVPKVGHKRLKLPPGCLSLLILDARSCFQMLHRSTLMKQGGSWVSSAVVSDKNPCWATALQGLRCTAEQSAHSRHQIWSTMQRQQHYAGLFIRFGKQQQ